jgi:MFS family permease
MTAMTRIAQITRSSALDALRFNNFRLYFFGQLISLSGTMMQRVAQGWLVYQLTRSELWLGVVAFAVGFPVLVCAPFAGVLADRFSRRRIMLITQIVEMIAAFVLAWLTFSGLVQSWHIAGLSLLLGVNSAFGEPARFSLLREMVDKEAIKSAISLNAIVMNTGAIIGPALAGIALLQFGAAWCFLINGVSYLAVIGSLWLMNIPESYRETTHQPVLQELRAGLRFVRRHETIGALLICATAVNVFGVGLLTTLFPAFAEVALNAPKTGNAMLNATLGIGSVIAAALNVWICNQVGRGRYVQFVALFVPAVSLIFALTRADWLAGALSMVLGFGYTSFFVSSNILIQTQVSDEFRGRVMSLWSLNRFAFAPISGLGIGLAAQAFGTPQVMIVCSLLCFAVCSMIVTRAAAVRKLI